MVSTRKSGANGQMVAMDDHGDVIDQSSGKRATVKTIQKKEPKAPKATQPKSSKVKSQPEPKPEPSAANDQGNPEGGESEAEANGNGYEAVEETVIEDKRPKKGPGRPRKDQTVNGNNTTETKNKHPDNEYDIPDETDSESTLRQDMTSKDFRKNFKKSANAMQAKLQSTYDSLSAHRQSVEKRLKVLDDVMFDDVNEMNRNGIYGEVFYNHPKYRGHYKPLPAVLPGDPFPAHSTDFDENDPRVQRLFPTDEHRAYQMDVFKNHLDNIEVSLEKASSLVKIAENIFTMAKGYKSALERQSKFAEKCFHTAETVKDRYIDRRIEERGRIQRMTRKEAPPVPRQEFHPTQSRVAIATDNNNFNRKRKLSAFEERQNQRLPKRRIIEPTPPPEPEVIDLVESDEDDAVPDITTPEPPATPPPAAERVIIEGFGNHTPGRTRRYEHPDDSDDDAAERTKDGILIDSRPWSEEENSILDLAMSHCQSKLQSIKIHFKHIRPNTCSQKYQAGGMT
ncbi:hypothetical protein H072_4552 [Dactylellina haptotyla CBS 200.50]|uniref:Uncharacterized protein n=1 Tax=Dactylellina haptotyla (strain CBS 200.50) TaxID=1284197 RepID=S8BQ03_DACHA|nr:hypothetical protein H072_4552 [Dactylellina haptotyla CBS 200.50]